MSGLALARGKARGRRAPPAEAGLPPAPVDLLKRIDVKRDVLKGDWQSDAGGLVAKSHPGGDAELQIPYTPPAEYDWTFERGARMERARADRRVRDGRQPESTVVLDGFGQTASGLETLDGKKGKENETTHKGQVFPVGKTVTFTLRVRKNGVAATADGQGLFDWKGDSARLGVHPQWVVPNKQQLFLGSQSNFRIGG